MEQDETLPKGLHICNETAKTTKLLKPYNCKICSVSCFSAVSLNEHVNGKKHKKKVEISTNEDLLNTTQPWDLQNNSKDFANMSDCSSEKTESKPAFEFKDYPHFVEYVKSFEIITEEDAKFVFNISQNLTKALLQYQKECTTKQVSSTPADTIVKENTNNSAEAKTIYSSSTSTCKLYQDDPLPAKPTDVPTVVNNQPSQNKTPTVPMVFHNIASTYPGGKADSTALAPRALPPNVTQETPLQDSMLSEDNTSTELFFESIKTMDESLVEEVFHKVAEINPAFKGMDISSVMKYLKETRRLQQP